VNEGIDMTENIKISRRDFILYGLAILIFAFLGVVMGNWYISNRQARNYDRQIQNARPHSVASIKSGDEVPSLEMLDLNGKPVNLQLLTGGSKTLIITLSQGCEPCALTIAEWNEQVDKIPPDLKIIGISNSAPDQARAYADETGFHYAIYCDTAHVLASDYGLEAFPTVIGVDKTNHVSFISEGWLEGFTPLEAYKIIDKGE
jgi:peroxiredoxin